MSDRNHPIRDQRSACPHLDNVEQSIPAIFAKIVELHREREAVGSESWPLGYGDLNSVANRLASFVLSRSGEIGDRVAILMGHDSALIAVILAVLKAGRTVLTLNTGDPPVRLKQICEDAAPVMIITDTLNQELAMEIAEAGCEVFCFEDVCSSSANHSPQVVAMPAAPAFLLYTSGSTGRPKGVIQNHRNILHYVRRYTEGFGLNSQDRFCLFASLSNGQGVMTTLCALLNGGTLYPYALRKRGVGDLAAWLAKNKITVFISAASVFRQFAMLVPEGLKLPHLRLVRLGAEAARSSDLDECRRITSSSCRFAHVLSTTETGNLAQFLCDPSWVPNNRRLPVGKPVEGVTLSLLGNDGAEVPSGEPGEIAVRSRYLSPGYWRDAVATAASFKVIPDTDERVYLTGDIGRLNSDGLLEHLGRKDRHHKLLGNRVDPGEIEDFLCKYPAVREAAVGIGPGSDNNVKLLAWIVPQQQSSLSSAALHDHLRKMLPSHMIPGQIIFVSSIPRSANGKVDFKELFQSQSAAAVGMTHPRTRMERQIAHIWSEVLGCPSSSINVHQEFFESGGDSLKAVDLTLRLSREFGRDFGPETLITQPTIAQFAEAVEAGRRANAPEPLFRFPTVSLLSLRAGGAGRPLLIIPGGFTGSDEVLLFASLTLHIRGDHPLSCVRLNLRERRVLPPLSLGGIARKIGNDYTSRYRHLVPVVIGECQACPLACETAQWLSRQLDTPPPLILLDPWHPRKPSSGTAVKHSIAISRYFHLLRSAAPLPYQGAVGLLCARETERFSVCKAWWDSQLNLDCIACEVPGNHLTYLREHRTSLAASLNAVLNKLGAE